MRTCSPIFSQNDFDMHVGNSYLLVVNKMSALVRHIVEFGSGRQKKVEETIYGVISNRSKSSNGPYWVLKFVLIRENPRDHAYSGFDAFGKPKRHLHIAMCLPNTFGALHWY